MLLACTGRTLPAAWWERAHRDARQLDVPLFCLQAADQRHARKNKTIDKQLTHQLLYGSKPTSHWQVARHAVSARKHDVRLSDVLAPHLDLWKTRWQRLWKWICTTKIKNACGTGKLVFVISCLNILPRVSGWNYSKESLRPWKMPLLETWEGQFENVADHTQDDAKTLFFVELMHADFKIDLKIGGENEKIEVIRWQFPLSHGNAAHCLQCARLDFGWRCGWLICVVLVAWKDDDWWLAIYVMLARARKTGKSHSTGHDWPSGRSFTQRAPCLSSRIDWQVGSQRCCHVGALAELASVWLSANFLTSYSAFGFNRLSAERSVGIRDGWTLWRSTDMFDAFCLSYWYVDRWYPDMIWHVWCRECF